MASFDGTTYQSLDTDFFGDGQTDANTQPLSTFKENVLYNNQRYIRKRSRRTSFGFLSDASAPRIMSSGFRTCYWHGFLEFGPDHSAMTVSMLGTIDDAPGTTIAQMKAELEFLAVAGGQQRVVHTETAEWNEGDGAGHSITVDLTDIIQDSRVFEVRLWLKANAATGDVNDDTTVDVDFEGNIDFASAADDYTANIDEASYLAKSSGVQGSILDLLAKNTISEVMTTPRVNAIGFGFDLQRYDLSYIQPAGIMIELESDPDVSTVLWAPKTQAEMLPQKPVLGQHVSRHGSNTDALFLEPKLIGMGPVGQKQPSSSNWPTDYHQRWPKVLGGGEYLEDITCRVLDTNSRIEIRGYLFGGHLISYEPINNNENIPEYTSRVDWDITMEIWQLDDTDTWSGSSAVDSVTETLPGFRLFPCTWNTNVPLLRQIYWGYGYNDATGSKTTYADYTFKEGQLYDVDFDYLQPFSITMEVPDSINTSLPIRLSLYSESITSGDVIWRAGTTSQQSSGNALMMLTSMTVTEIPRLT